MKIKAICAALAAFLVFGAAAFGAELVSYPVADIGVTLGIPAEYNYVFTRDISDDDPILADWGISKGELFENGNIYLEALTEDQNDELIVMAMDTDWSEMYYDFNTVSDEDLMALAEYTHSLVNKDGGANVAYDEYVLFKGQPQVPFIKAKGRFQTDTAEGGVVQYVTVLNGSFYTLSFNFYGGAVSEADDALTEEVVSALTFDAVKAPKKSKDSLLYVVVIVALVAVIAGLLLVIRRQKYSLKAPENGAAAEEPAATAGTAETEREE